MNKYASHVMVFVAGFLICVFAFWAVFGSGGGGATLLSVRSPHPGLRTAGSEQIARAADIVGKYVVSIDTVVKPAVTDFFGVPMEAAPMEGKGSGVIISPNGYIVTNNHVVMNASHLTATLYNGKQYDAKLIGRDPKTDVAVIKIAQSGLPAAKFGDSDTLKVGDWVIAVGNSLGLGPTVTAGIISATKRGPIAIGREVLEDVIQTDAAVNKGNSGGALADLNGDLVGINTAIASSGPDGGNIGIGWAVPSKTVEKVAKDLIATGKVRRPWLGIVYQPYNADVRKELEQHGATGLPQQDGARVRQVMDKSPAADAGLEPEDIILQINGRSISGTGKAENGKVTVASEINASRVGARVLLKVWHDRTGRISTVGARVGEMPADLLDEKPQPSRPDEGMRMPFGP
jgi:S1-C subfamily serine protease